MTPVGGGKAVAYTRCTTFVGSIEDTYNLSKWQQRMVALGLSDRSDLQLAVAAHREDKSKLNAICEDAIEAARGHAAATTGTALHAITETHDRGNPVGTLPADAQADLDAYVMATKALKPLHIEQFMVQDPLKVGGTPDRISRYVDGKRYVTDLKTGSLDFGFLKIAAQLAVYARSLPYDVETGKRLEPHGAEVDKGIVIHLPAGSATCTLYWVDLLAGWEVVRLCKQVREKRSLPAKSVFSPIGGPNAVPLPAAAPTLPELVTAAKTPDDVRALWRAHATDWTDELTELARTRITQLEGATA
ncbi:hypothetical protein ACFVWG_23895 [Kribbella sp. NPDC058245]|uniref:hypothetical protein n=1 Tax=Kribbella sp. NPDC058245 TaxID=3346399 RepID=UPI0036F03F12